ncbi:MAG: hypothetical protein UY20_C0004G0004 [Candidatus Yanofskybacteria bacterium GW2011_GWA1_48_10]|uniref:Ribonuclease VapC n=1 Tax=Candidatus Yanofskybacteria bacterium GW2011_GWA1_48_10 TaxID=1619022 RepID=A0A0G1U6V6_9BACT|nr:MAG: hypothetical protein UW69_C0031G0005 [Microgenomates group bacterium GW2011_GWA2_44_7]KKU89822.1 MAG: hypothetical protein UY20_C0004G0004 [Candidatus Yanofskybacteria bacterium GW2011_GWA1_48_10]
MKLILDTSIIVDKLRGGDRWDRVLGQLTKEDELYLPTIVVLELFAGTSTRRPEVAKKIRRLLTFFNILDLTTDIAQRAGEIYRDVTVTLDLPDYIVAASALEIGATVITLNQKHFSKIPGIRIYQL